MALPEGWKSAGSTIESGQAWVYQVRRTHESGGPLFGLKRLKNEKRRARFVREVATMERLRKEHGASVPDVVERGLEDKRPWFVMPWFSNGSLEDAVDDGRFREDLTAGLSTLIELASQVGKVHAAALAHRDLKPANVLFSDDGGVALSDFGLCLDLEDVDDRVTETHEAVGSRHYIAPENEGGINEDVDQRPADFYAFGKLLWAVLTGRQPPPREQMLEPEYCLANAMDDPRLASLDGLLRDLLNRDPRARLNDWSEVISELTAVNGVLHGVKAPKVRSTREDAVAAARRVRSLTEIDMALEHQEEEDRHQRWVRDLFTHLSSRSNAAERTLAPLTREVVDVLNISASTGGRPEPQLLANAGLEVPPGAFAASLIGMGDAICFIIYSPKAIRMFPTMSIRVWVAVSDNEAWIVRVPMFAPAGESEVVAEFLLQELFRIVGPLRPFRQSTRDTAAAVIDETVELFVSLAEQYVAILGERQDPGNPESWSGRQFRS